MTIDALTSLSPSERAVDAQQRAITTWRDAGMHVRSFNHPTEIAALTSCYDVEFVSVERTAFSVFGLHLIPINRIIEWAAEHDATVMIINADIELRLAPWALQRARRVAEGGLCYWIRHNHDDNLARATVEPFGIDAFLFAARDVGIVPDSFLSMGQPFWDYWLPYLFASQHRPLVCVDFPAVFHRRHAQQWSWNDWHRCGVELGRVIGRLGANQSMAACRAMEAHIRDTIGRARTRLSPRPFSIREWVERRFDDARAKTFLELGAHRGTDTEWLSCIPGVTIHAFEPDPRNEQPPRPNVTVHRAAVGDVDGRAAFILSESGWGQKWTYSSSLKHPKNHLTLYPVTFGETVTVDEITLDSFAQRNNIAAVDFIWADIQGAEGEMVRGGRELLRRTRYLYTEYSDEELYEGQSTLADILELLPDYRVIELWPENVLLENRGFRENA